MKTHYAASNSNVSLCGARGSIELASNWTYVDCKNCLKKGDIDRLRATEAAYAEVENERKHAEQVAQYEARVAKEKAEVEAAKPEARVFVVTANVEGSDSWIVGVYRSKEGAEAAIEASCDEEGFERDELSIEESGLWA